VKNIFLTTILLALSPILFGAESNKDNKTYLVDENCSLRVDIGNVYAMGRNNSIYDTSEYDRHNVGGTIIRTSIDNFPYEKVSALYIRCNFFDAKRRNDLPEWEEVDQNRTPKDHIFISINKESSKKIVFKDLPPQLQSNFKALKVKAELLLLKPGQTEDTPYENRYSSPHRSAYGQEISKTPYVDFYNNSLALVEHVYGSELLKNVAQSVKPQNKNVTIRTASYFSDFYERYKRYSYLVPIGILGLGLAYTCSLRNSGYLNGTH
jgi:hypothetical protein